MRPLRQRISRTTINFPIPILVFRWAEKLQSLVTHCTDHLLGKLHSRTAFYQPLDSVPNKPLAFRGTETQALPMLVYQSFSIPAIRQRTHQGRKFAILAALGWFLKEGLQDLRFWHRFGNLGILRVSKLETTQSRHTGARLHVTV